jgi:hypothetical protein
MTAKKSITMTTATPIMAAVDDDDYEHDPAKTVKPITIVVRID